MKVFGPMQNGTMMRLVAGQVALPPAFFQLSVEGLKAVVCSVVLMSRRAQLGEVYS